MQHLSIEMAQRALHPTLGVFGCLSIIFGAATRDVFAVILSMIIVALSLYHGLQDFGYMAGTRPMTSTNGPLQRPLVREQPLSERARPMLERADEIDRDGRIREITREEVEKLVAQYKDVPNMRVNASNTFFSVPELHEEP